MYDLLLKGGTVLDPSSRLDGAMDVAVEQGVIARIAPRIARDGGRAHHRRAGQDVTPGLIDLHAHVFEGVNRTGVNPDLGGVLRGRHHHRGRGQRGRGHVRRAFRATSCPSCHTEIIPFLHICQTGLATMPDIIAESSINLDDTLRVVDRAQGA